ncbi:hypothetical protein SEA_SPILLED_122 [Streptomyces phage Spilled]|nr:hypothetical protein SEA_SPILLED_122 [Streptomyces phage Spilled]
MVRYIICAGLFHRSIMLRKGKKQKDCYHVNVRSIHGDEIIHSGYKRAYCYDCERYLPTLPPKGRNG